MKRAALLLVVVLTSPVVAQSPPASIAQAASMAAPKIEVKYTQFTLPNGLRVILHEDHSVPMVSVDMWYHVGSARERTGRTGFAHLLAHPLFMGSRADERR